MTTIGVLGTCQASSYAAAFERLVPGATAEFFYANLATPAEVHACAARVDLFVTQPLEDAAFGDLRSSCFAQYGAVLVPHVVYTGFHPDLTVAPKWGVAHSPMHGYHSALVAACFCLGIRASRVGALFNRYVYAELGYLDEHERATSFLIAACDRLGYDVSEHIRRWSAESSFMHTLNHPRARVIHDLATLCLAKHGVAIAATHADPLETWPEDPLGYIQWPVHEAVADQVGVAADPNFTEGEATSTLQEFIETSYRNYADADLGELAALDAVRAAMEQLTRIGLR